MSNNVIAWPRTGQMWHVFNTEGASLCGNWRDPVEGKILAIESAGAWVRGQDCVGCWRLAGLPVGSGRRIEAPMEVAAEAADALPAWATKRLAGS